MAFAGAGPSGRRVRVADVVRIDRHQVGGAQRLALPRMGAARRRRMPCLHCVLLVNELTVTWNI